MFTIQAKSSMSFSPFYEDMDNGDFETVDAAVSAMRDLESNLGYRNMRVVDENNNVEIYGIEGDED